MSDFNPAFIILPVVAFIVITAITTIILEKKRKEALAQVAGSMGFMYSEKAPEDFLKKLQKDFKFLRKRSSKIFNFIEGRQRGIKWKIFDFRYTTSSGKSSNTHNQTIALAITEKEYLPISIHPRTFGLAFVVSGNEVKFEEGEFSKKYIVFGDIQAKSVLTAEFRNQLANEEKKYSIEILGNKVAFYRKNRRIKPANFTEYYQMLTRFVSML